MVAIYLSFASFEKAELQDLSLGITSILRVFYFDSVTLVQGGLILYFWVETSPYYLLQHLVVINQPCIYEI